jgi:single-strand DNA-binding protein
LTKDPIVKTVGAGTQVAEFAIAVNRISKDQPSDFFNVKVWGKSADYCGQYLTKGQRVSISGRMEMNKVERDGATQTYWSVVADQVNGLDKSGEQQEQTAKPSSKMDDIEDPFA